MIPLSVWPGVSVQEEAVADLEAQTADMVASEALTPEQVEAARRAPFADLAAVLADLAAEFMGMPGARAGDLHEAVALGMARALSRSGIVEEVFALLRPVTARHLSANALCNALAKSRGVDLESVSREEVGRALDALLAAQRVAFTWGEFNGYSYKAWYSLGGGTLETELTPAPLARAARARRRR